MNYTEMIGLVVIWIAVITLLLIVLSLFSVFVFNYLGRFYKAIKAIGFITAAYWWHKKNPGMSLRCLATAMRYRRKLRQRESYNEDENKENK